MSSVEWRELLKYRSVTTGGQEGEIPRYLIDNLIDTLNQGTSGNLGFLFVPSNTLTANDHCPDLGPNGTRCTVQVTHDLDPTIMGGMLRPRFNGVDEWWETYDRSYLSAVVGGVDVAFSVGCAFRMVLPNAANKQLVCKWDMDTPNAEWELILTDAEFPAFILFDNDVPASQRGRHYNVALTAGRWYIIIATYDGRGGLTADEGINIYLYDAVNLWQGAVDSLDSNGIGDYVDMHDTVQPVMLGAADVAVGPLPGEWFFGEVMLSFMTLGDLSNVRSYSSSGGVRSEITYAEHAVAIMRRMLALP